MWWGGVGRRGSGGGGALFSGLGFDALAALAFGAVEGGVDAAEQVTGGVGGACLGDAKAGAGPEGEQAGGSGQGGDGSHTFGDLEGVGQADAGEDD